MDLKKKFVLSLHYTKLKKNSNNGWSKRLGLQNKPKSDLDMTRNNLIVRLL